MANSLVAPPKVAKYHRVTEAAKARRRKLYQSRDVRNKKLSLSELWEYKHLLVGYREQVERINAICFQQAWPGEIALRARLSPDEETVTIARYSPRTYSAWIRTDRPDVSFGILSPSNSLRADVDPGDLHSQTVAELETTAEMLLEFAGRLKADKKQNPKAWPILPTLTQFIAREPAKGGA